MKKFSTGRHFHGRNSHLNKVHKLWNKFAWKIFSTGRNLHGKKYAWKKIVTEPNIIGMLLFYAMRSKNAYFNADMLS